MSLSRLQLAIMFGDDVPEDILIDNGLMNARSTRVFDVAESNPPPNSSSNSSSSTSTGPQIVPVVPVDRPAAMPPPPAGPIRIQPDRNIPTARAVMGARIGNASLYMNDQTLRQNYLTLTGITENYGAQVTSVLNRQMPNSGFNWILNRHFQNGGLSIAGHLAQNPQIRNAFGPNLADGTFPSGVAEFMQFLEVQIQSHFALNIPRSLNSVGPRQMYSQLHQLLNVDRNGVCTVLSNLFYKFYSGGRIKAFNQTRWSGDFKTILDSVIETIKRTFAENPRQSDFLRITDPLVQVPVRADNHAHRWLYHLREHSPKLMLIFAISMIRLPSINVSRPNELQNFHFVFPIQYIPDDGGVGNDGEDDEEDEIRITASHTDMRDQRLFYFIPEHNRVVGIWNSRSWVRDVHGGVTREFVWNYNVNLLRSCVVRVPLPGRIRNNDGCLNIARLLTSRINNLYDFIRRKNPFNLPPADDGLTRLYASISVYADRDRQLLQIPWILEGSLNSGVVYDNSQFISHVNNIMNNTSSGTRALHGDALIPVYYFYFQFLRDPNHGLAQARPEAEEEQENRRARTAQIAQLKAPSKLKSLDGMLVGAPYVGTKKEKHFLLGSLINRFTTSNALFQTPQRELNNCLLMSLIKAQLYCFDFSDDMKCIKVSFTGTNYKAHQCENYYVEAIHNYPVQKDYPFIYRENGTTYIRLFQSTKYTDGKKWLAGSKDDEENDAWELAAEEILFYLENINERQIDYRNISDLGQCFADYFRVAISIYDVEMRCSRVHLITPDKKTAKELVREEKCLKMIHVVFDQGHIHAVSNLQAFVKNQARKEKLRFHNYCPICDKKQCRDLCKSYESTLVHITTCLESNEFHIGFRDEETKQVETQFKEVRIAWRKNNRGKFEPYNQCIQCGQEIEQHNYLSHICYVPIRKNVELVESRIFVYDLECSQSIDELGLYKHECNCLYVYQVYGDNSNGEYFENEISFIEAITTQERFLNSTFVAHNGGSYDVHFILRILERGEIGHTYVPSPTSKHKFIQIYLTESNIKFIDFMRFIPGSLKNIAESFGVSVAKGDFPHRFNNGRNDEYEGAIPPIYSEEDYWGLDSFRSKKEQDQFISWYNNQLLLYCSCSGECSCDKMKWNFQTEIKKYCLLDVIVLAEIVKKYRTECMNFENEEIISNGEKAVRWKAPCLDPLQFMTLPQITMQTLVHGFVRSDSNEAYGFDGITTYYHKVRGGQCDEGLLWLLKIQETQSELILHRGNCLKEYYHFETNMSLDGWCPQLDTAYVFLKCSYWGCPKCYLEQNELNLLIPERGLYASDVRNNLQGWLHLLNSSFTHIITKWQCDFNTSFIDPYLMKCSKLLKPEDCFYGGRTEVFQLYANSQRLQEEIQYYDVTSLYPSVYAHHILPIGVPRHILGFEVDVARFHPTASNRYFGYARVRVTPKATDILGLLPQRDPVTGRLYFPVYPMEGSWGTEELYLAMQNGYEINDIYELYYWEENQRSDQHLRGYVDYFLRMKQEAEGWIKNGASSESPDETEQNEIVERLYIQNGNLGKIRPNKVKKNPVQRALAKLYLNALWGKFAQKSSKSEHTTIYGTQQFLELWNDKRIIKESCLFREISQGVYKVSYSMKEEYVTPVRHGNLFIAAKVTETARCVLHKQMLRVGPEKVIYCDTDSIIFLKDPNLGDLVGVGLGKWTNEYPNHVILQIYALAPKLYSLMLQNANGPSEVFRAKGIQMSLENQERMKFNNIKVLIEDLMGASSSPTYVSVKNFSIFTNSGNSALPYGQVYSRYNHKNVRAIITKRIFKIMTPIDWASISQIRTYPLGFDLG
jgi:hypothetical protein